MGEFVKPESLAEKHRRGGAMGGAARSEAKREAARANGRKGGRPIKADVPRCFCGAHTLKRALARWPARHTERWCKA